MCPKRFQNEFKKIVEGTTAFDVDRLVPVHNWLAVAANWVSAPAKNCAQSDSKNLIGLIVRAASLPLNSGNGGVCGLRNIQVCRLFNLSWKNGDLIAPDVAPMRSGELVAALIVFCECPFDGLRELAREKQVGIFRHLFKGGDKHPGGNNLRRRSRDRERAGYLAQFLFFVFRWDRI